MKKSRFFNLNLRDVLHGLISTIIGAVITSLGQGLSTGSVDPKTIALGAGVAGLSYLGTQLPKNSNGEIFTPEDENSTK